jgi:hypothetical protein
VRYYAEFADEVDAWLERGREMAERHEALSRKEQAALACGSCSTRTFPSRSPSSFEPAATTSSH